jgi:A/G-specific adenine glycosylase
MAHAQSTFFSAYIEKRPMVRILRTSQLTVHPMLTGPARSRFRKNLLAWFKQFQRDLPWRRTSDPYAIWLSEIMLQQTRVAAVIPYFERFLQHFPTIQDLAAAPEEDVLRLWAGLGYYSRARNLQNAARQIVALHNGAFPSDETNALELSGIGNYTAAAILSIAFGKNLAVLDGNVARVVARLGAIRGDLRAGNRWLELQNAATKLLDPEHPGDWNQAMMELGATLCTPRAPQCLLCPVNEFCEARKKGLVDVIPEKRKRRDTVQVLLAAIVFADSKDRTVLLPPPKVVKSSTGSEDIPALLSRMWHFPTIQLSGHTVLKQKRSRSAGQPTKKDTPTCAAVELQKYVEAEFLSGRKLPTDLQPLKQVRHAVTYRAITLLSFLAKVPKLPRIAGAKILPLADLSSVPVSNLTRKVAHSAIAGP